jgi:isoamylase
MILGGDEFARTQKGNNNAYCQDNEISWVDWEGIGPEARSLAAFAGRLLMIRDALPMLRRGRFLTGHYDEELGVKDVAWLDPAATEMTPEQWGDANARCLGVLLDGRAQETGIRRLGTDVTLLLILNAHHDVVQFTLPEAVGGSRWRCLVDTNHEEAGTLERYDFGHVYEVTGRSLLLFILEPARTKGARASAAERSYQHVVQALEDAAPPALPRSGGG